ncbi:endonuclease/exonuclease/phosphatase family protein [Thalassotalea aquiviva]|uniref:endonuclease/exonuclease/phosphatase family protein n=1 Tax=Thalassotalea aquiviva TaxID=3242415 RepID=UPI00352A7C26
MEALNYLPYNKGVSPNPTGQELPQALKSEHPQIKNIAEIIQRVNPDIIVLNEFDRVDQNQGNLSIFIEQFLHQSQQGQKAVHYPYRYQGPVNSGLVSPFDLNHNGRQGQLPQDGYGFGYFLGHYGMALLSKFPIKERQIRTFQRFKWADMPNALAPMHPNTQTPWYEHKVWSQLRLSSKSHWDIPILIGQSTIQLLISHPTPPVFDGPERRNACRNHDEIRFWYDYISTDKCGYIYDDNGHYGGITPEHGFVILGDLNACANEGDGLTGSIQSLLSHPQIIDSKPESLGAKAHSPNNPFAKNHTSDWRMRADYVLPSKPHFTVNASGVFWPSKNSSAHHLVLNRASASDHRLVWLDLTLNQ